MPSHPRTGVQQFDSSWQKAVAWAQSNGIGPSSYLPVYQLDLTRIQNGEYPMGGAERNLAILAAHNPNQVTNVPQDNPRPTNIIGNALSDVGKIATGIAGIFTGSFERQVWDSAKTTFKGITDPASLESKTGGFGGTIGNWLNNTLLAYLPGAADIGTVLQNDPTLTGSKGLEALLGHPVLSVLDVLPGAGGAATRAARAVGATEIAASLARRGGDRSAIGEIVNQLGSSTRGGKAGVDLYGHLKTKLSVRDRIEKFAGRLGPGGSGVGPAIGSLSEAIANASSMTSDLYVWLMHGPTKALEGLPEADVKRIETILSTSRTGGGDTYAEAMRDPGFSPQAKDALQQWMNGPLRFATENELFAGNLRPTRGLDGEVGMWAASGKRVRGVLRAKNAAEAARRRAMEKLDELEPYVARVELLDQMRAGAVGDMSAALSAARRQVFADPALTRPITRELPDHKGLLGKSKEGAGRFRGAQGISRADQVQAVVGEGGIYEKFVQQVQKSSDPDLIGELATATKNRLRAWGPQSVRAAEHPALAALYHQADVMEKWARKYRAEQKAIDREIHGTEAMRHHFLEEQIAYRKLGLQTVKDRQKEERATLDGDYRRAKAQRAGTFAAKVRQINEARVYSIEIIRTQGDREARQMTARVVNAEIMPRVRAKEREVNQNAAAQIKQAKRDHLAAAKLQWTEYQRDSSRMVRRHYTELTKAKKVIAGEVQGLGETLAESVRYGDAIRAFHQAVYDTPADQYRDVFVALIHKHIRENEETSALAIATDRYIEDKPKMTAKRLAEIRGNPDVVAELTLAHFAEILKQPDLDPELAKEAAAEMEEYRADAHEELKTLIGQGFRVPYIPTATSFDERLGRDSMAPIIGHGIPKPDMAKEKMWDITPRKDDWALGINKAVVQALQRDATIYLAEHYLKPMALTSQQVNDFLLVFKKPELRAAGGNLVHEYQHLTAEDLGLEKFDPVALFGFNLPRWSKADALYLPKTIVDTLRKFEQQRKASLLSKSNKVFRYSILGLSPRYTAHIVFGGTMMLALRSSPYAMTMIGQAVRALRDGEIPSTLSRHAVEEGFEEPITMLQRAQGKDMHRLIVGEHIEQVQKVKAAAAKPIHVLRAMADINFRFTRYVRDLQASIAYLDGAAQVARREGKVEIEDPETGRMVSVSSERAVKEGIHHVQQVFGNLRRMSPLERGVAQSVMPFYGWQKHILGYVLSFPIDHPWRALVLSQLAFHSSQDVPLAYPIRLQLLMFLGSPDSQGNVNAVDVRSLDPFRDVANYGTWAGFFESLNPALEAPMAMAFGPGAVFGTSSLYPNVTYNAFYGIRTATSGGNWITGLEQWVPQAGAVVSAAQAAGGLRSEWQTNRSAAIKTMLEAMNIPFVTPPVNLKQLAARDETARYETAKTAAYNAFSSGDFSGIQGYKTVPNPLNAAFQITPAQLEALYHQAQVATPGVAPIESLLPPPTPYGW